MYGNITTQDMIFMEIRIVQMLRYDWLKGVLDTYRVSVLGMYMTYRYILIS